MILSDSPWFGLETGQIDTRRVDASARWNWFWAVMPKTDLAFVLKPSRLPDPLPDLPKLKNLEICFQTLRGGPILYIRLKDSTQLELFETLCRDVMNAGEQANSEIEAIERAIGRTFRWHYLMRGGKLDVLSEEAQKGLIGEIEVLKLLLANLDPKSAISAWTGPSGAPKDFELQADCIEVKARRGASQPFVHISNEYQLSDVKNRRLWLGVLSVDKVQFPNGKTLTHFVNEVTEFLYRTDPSAITDWNLHLAETGYDVLHDYSAWYWISSSPEFYSVTEGFPRITVPVTLGVSNVTYTVSLSACSPFSIDWEVIRSKILKSK